MKLAPAKQNHKISLSNEEKFVLISGNSNRILGEEIAKTLDTDLSHASIRRFADMEVFIEVEENARGKDVFILQSTCFPANDHLMELLVLIDAIKRGSANRITAILPYFGYARQDRKTGPRTPISARLVANLLETAGADRILTIDLHAAQIQGFFNCPVDNLYGRPVFINHLAKSGFEPENMVIVSPDVGGVARARSLAEKLGCDLAIIDKRRERAGMSEVMNVIGNVQGRDCVLVDDIVDSAGTLCNAAAALRDQGGAAVYALATHGVLSGGAVGRIMDSAIEKLFITNSIPPMETVKNCPKIEVISIADLLASAIHNIYHEKSVSVLFD